MRRFFIAALICICIAGPVIPACCQEDDAAMEKSESQLEENLDSEIKSEQAEGTAEEKEANTEFQAGEPMSL